MAEQIRRLDEELERTKAIHKGTSLHWKLAEKNGSDVQFFRTVNGQRGEERFEQAAAFMVELAEFMWFYEDCVMCADVDGYYVVEALEHSEQYGAVQTRTDVEVVR